MTHAVWRGGLADGSAILPSGVVSDIATERYRQELTYWVDVFRDPTSVMPDVKEMRGTVHGWHHERYSEMCEMMGVAVGEELVEWCGQRVAVEVGGGPLPLVGSAPWKTAIAVDPLIEGYLIENLCRPIINNLVCIAAPGEAIPLPTGTADVVVAENCIDHVECPSVVLGELARVTKPGGLLWMLVDLKDSVDVLHPHSFDAERVRTLLTDAGFEVEHERVTEGHASHPDAHGEMRVMCIRIGPE